MADYSDLFRENPQLFAQAIAAAMGAQLPQAQQQESPPVEAPPPAAEPAAPAPVETPPPVEPAPTQPVQAPPPVEQPPVEAEAAPPTGPIDMRVTAPVTVPTGSLAQQQTQLRDENIAAANEVAESFEREGDAKAQGASEAAKIYAQQAQVADRYAQAAERNYNTHQERAAHYRQLVDEDFERLQKEPPRPGNLKNIFNVITGIIGAAAGGEQGAALGMLRQHVNRQAEEDAQERGLAQQRIETAGKIQDRILSDSTNEFDAASKLVAGQWLVAARQLDQVAQESNVPAFREQALRLATSSRQQARDLLEHNVQAQVQQQAKARAASMRTRWEDLSQRDLEVLASQGLLPVEVAKKLADTQKAQREAKGEGEGGAALKQEAAKSLRLYDAAEPDAKVLRDAIAKLDAKGSDDVPGVGPLAGLAGDWAISKEGVRLRQAVKKVLKAQLRDESGAAISDDELEAYLDDRGMSQNATNADFLAGARIALDEFEQKRAIARQAAGLGDGTPQGGPATNAYAEFESRAGARPKGAR